MLSYFSAADNESLHRVNEVGHVLDSLLANYDKRVRPDAGGEKGKIITVFYLLALFGVD